MTTNPQENERVPQEEQPSIPPVWRPLDAYRRALVVAVYARATAYASGIARRLAAAGEEPDLMGIAMEALVIAASTFEIVSAEADSRVLLGLARERIRGTMLDAFDRAVQNRRFNRGARAVLADASRRLVWLCDQEEDAKARREVRHRSIEYAVAYVRTWSRHTAHGDAEEAIRSERLCRVFEMAEQCLDRKDAELIRNRFDDELTIQEIAARAGHSEDTTKRQLRAALDKLRVRFEGVGITSNDLLAWAA